MLCHWVLPLLVGALVAVIVFICEAAEHVICSDQHANNRSLNPDVAKLFSHVPCTVLAPVPVGLVMAESTVRTEDIMLAVAMGEPEEGRHILAG